jgi:hypothetical protein
MIGGELVQMALTCRHFRGVAKMVRPALSVGRLSTRLLGRGGCYQVTVWFTLPRGWVCLPLESVQLMVMWYLVRVLRPSKDSV